MTTASHSALLQQTDFRLLLAERLVSALAGVGFATLIGYQLYTMTGDPLALGWLGLIEAILEGIHDHSGHRGVSELAGPEGP